MDNQKMDFDSQPEQSGEASVKLLKALWTFLKCRNQLLQDAKALLREIGAFDEKKAAIDNGTWQEKEALIVESGVLEEKVRKSTEQLKFLCENYEELRERVNAYCGKEMMQEPKNWEAIKKLYDEMHGEDDADWWKQSS